MSEVVLLILPTVVKERTTLHKNVDEKLIVHEIKAAQDMHIRPLLGSILFDKLLTDIAADTLAGDYLLLMDNFIVDALCNYVMAEMPDTLNYQFWNKGLASKTTDNSQTPSMSDMYNIVAKYKKRAEHYANACRLWLVQNSTNRIPEYYAAGGVDKVNPDRNSYTIPIYLGGGDSHCGRANHDPNYNSNDPYYEY